MIELNNFGEVVKALKEGKTAYRAGWNGKNMYIYLNSGSADLDFLGFPKTTEKGNTLYGVHISLFDKGDAGTVTRMPNINMAGSNGETVTGWLASQVDILAEDWIIS